MPSPIASARRRPQRIHLASASLDKEPAITLSEAFDTIERWSKEGQSIDLCVYRYGRVTIDRGGIERGLTSCPLCGAITGMGHITVSHEDGRRVSIDLPLYHYVQVDHPISESLAASLIDIVSDA